MSTLNIQLLCRRSIDFPELAIFVSRPGAMINLHWLELPIARTIFHGPKGVRAIEVRLFTCQLFLGGELYKYLCFRSNRNICVITCFILQRYYYYNKIVLSKNFIGAI